MFVDRNQAGRLEQVETLARDWFASRLPAQSRLVALAGS
jgi:hypothetical protein